MTDTTIFIAEFAIETRTDTGSAVITLVHRPTGAREGMTGEDLACVLDHLNTASSADEFRETAYEIMRDAGALEYIEGVGYMTPDGALEMAHELACEAHHRRQESRSGVFL